MRPKQQPTRPQLSLERESSPCSARHAGGGFHGTNKLVPLPVFTSQDQSSSAEEVLP